MQPIAGELIEIRRRRTDGHAAAKAAEIAPADIVHHENEDVGTLLAARQMVGEFGLGDIDLTAMHERWLEVVGRTHGRRGDRIELGHVFHHREH